MRADNKFIEYCTECLSEGTDIDSCDGTCYTKWRLLDKND